MFIGSRLVNLRPRSVVWVATALAAVILLAAPAGVVEAHEADDNHGFRILPSAEIEADSGDLEVELAITETGHPESVTEDGFSWNIFWFRYEYVEEGVFDCSKEHFISPWELEDWLSDNGYEAAVYETQKDIYKKFRISYIFGRGGSWSARIFSDADDLTGYKDTDGKLAFCFMIEHEDGTHLALNNIVLNFSNLATSPTGVGLGEIEGVRDNTLEDEGAEAETGGAAGQSGGDTSGGGSGNDDVSGTSPVAARAGAGSNPASSPGTGSAGKTPSSTPDTGILDDPGSNLPLYAAFVVSIAMAGAFFKVRKSMRKHKN